MQKFSITVSIKFLINEAQQKKSLKQLKPANRPGLKLFNR